MGSFSVGCGKLLGSVGCYDYFEGGEEGLTLEGLVAILYVYIGTIVY